MFNLRARNGKVDIAGCVRVDLASVINFFLLILFLYVVRVILAPTSPRISLP